MTDKDLVDLVQDKLFDMICAGGGDGESLRVVAQDIVKEIKEALNISDSDSG